jgi:putative oxidoreductase
MENLFYAGQIIFGAYFVLMGLMHFLKMKMMTDFAKFKGLPMPQMGVALSGVVLVLGGLSIIFERYTEYGMWALISFLVLATLVFHRFWEDKGAQDKMNNMVNFMKNIAIVGAMLMLLGYM